MHAVLEDRKNLKGIKRVWQSTKDSLAGLYFLITHEKSVYVQIFMDAIAILLGIFFSVTLREWLVLLIAFGFMIVTELLNTGIEKTVDLVTKDYEDLAKHAKDVSSGACFIMGIVAILIELVVFIPYITEFFGR